MNGTVRFDLRWWVYGLIAFAIVIGLGATLITGSPFGIVDHQAAGTAARVNEIQQSWRDGGVRNLAIAAMIGDMIFIGIYAWGSYWAGRSIAASSATALRIIGTVVWIAAIVFVVTDYLETSLQLVQLIQEEGSEQLAGIAATARQPKSVAWIVTFIGVLAALAIRRFGSPDA